VKLLGVGKAVNSLASKQSFQAMNKKVLLKEEQLWLGAVGPGRGPTHSGLSSPIQGGIHCECLLWAGSHAEGSAPLLRGHWVKSIMV